MAIQFQFQSSGYILKQESFQVYYIEIDQNGTDIHITINNETTKESLESVEDFIYPAEIIIGK